MCGSRRSYHPGTCALLWPQRPLQQRCETQCHRQRAKAPQCPFSCAPQRDPVVWPHSSIVTFCYIHNLWCTVLFDHQLQEARRCDATSSPQKQATRLPNPPAHTHTHAHTHTVQQWKQKADSRHLMKPLKGEQSPGFNVSIGCMPQLKSRLSQNVSSCRLHLGLRAEPSMFGLHGSSLSSTRRNPPPPAHTNRTNTRDKTDQQT